MSTETLQAVKVGDIFKSSWGYDQTNIDFYEVVHVSASGKTIKVAQLRTQYLDSDATGHHDRVVPVAGSFYVRPGAEEPKTLTRRVTASPGWGSNGPRWYFKVTSYAGAFSWDGRPAYETNSQFGH